MEVGHQVRLYVYRRAWHPPEIAVALRLLSAEARRVFPGRRRSRPSIQTVYFHADPDQAFVAVSLLVAAGPRQYGTIATDQWRDSLGRSRWWALVKSRMRSQQKQTRRKR